MLDYKDLVTYVLQVSDIVKMAVGNSDGVNIKRVSNLSNQNPLVSIEEDKPLAEALKLFKQSRTQRIVVIKPSESSNQFVGVLSQSTIASFLTSKYGVLQTPRPEAGLWPEGEKSVADLGLVKGSVVSVTTHETVLDALKSMHDHNITSVALVDRSSGYDQLIGSVSMSDMKEVFSQRGGYKYLYDNVFKFFQKLRSSQGLENDGNDKAPVFVIHPSTSVISALEKMSATHGHRVWIVEGADKLVGVLSLTDIIGVMGV
ncbi:MAG: hypothetical protein SGCHY_005600 [Lobulomycetales sp.]